MKKQHEENRKAAFEAWLGGEGGPSFGEFLRGLEGDLPKRKVVRTEWKVEVWDEGNWEVDICGLTDVGGALGRAGSLRGKGYTARVMRVTVYRGKKTPAPVAACCCDGINKAVAAERKHIAEYLSSDLYMTPDVCRVIQNVRDGLP